jgi:uncharacterized protein YacL
VLVTSGHVEVIMDAATIGALAALIIALAGLITIIGTVLKSIKIEINDAAWNLGITTLATVTLGVIFGVLIGGAIAPPVSTEPWFKSYQTVVGATVALVAALIAFHNTTRSLEQAAELERNRRSRKHAATRATLR